MSLNNKAAESKYNVKIPIPGPVGVIATAQSEDIPCHVETQLRIEVTGVGPSSEIQVYGRIRSSTLWQYIATVVGPVTGIADISTYDYVRYFQSVSDGAGQLIASGFIFSSGGGGGGGGGDASAANQVAGNSILTQINNKTPGSLLANKIYDNIQMSYTATTDVFSYYNGATLTATTTITYTDSTKAIVLSVQRV